MKRERRFGYTRKELEQLLAEESAKASVWSRTGKKELYETTHEIINNYLCAWEEVRDAEVR